jgi:tetratricopeptide (TPR) repeat protein
LVRIVGVGERLLDGVIEDLVTAVHRRRPESHELLEKADYLFALATQLDWTDDVAADIEDLKRHLAAGWERRLWEASTKAKRHLLSGDPGSAAGALKEAVREIAMGAEWRPLAFSSYDDLVDPESLEAGGTTRDDAPPSDAAAHASDTIPAAEFDPLIGTVLDGRYLVTGALGEGGMGRVYRATHVLMDKQVALKVIHTDLVHVEDITQRFEREAKSSSRLTDPHCITVTDFGRTPDGTLFLVMELLDGESLETRMSGGRCLTVEKALDVVKQLLRGLGHAHAQGVVHRDLKPENVYLTTHGEETDFVKIIDFGIAKLVSTEEGGENLTRKGVVFGTPKYMSPEQAAGDKIDQRTDLYTVGVMLWEMLTGTAPFEADSEIDVVWKHLTAPPPLLADRGRFPRGLQELIDRAMAKRPDDRFASAEEFLEAIGRLDPEAEPPTGVFELVHKLEQRAVRVSPPRRLSRLPGRWRLVIASACALLVVGIIVATAVGGDDEEKPEPVVVVQPERTSEKHEIIDESAELLDRAAAQIRIGRGAEAVITVKEALVLKPGHPPALLLLGHAELSSGERDQAMKDYEKALAADAALAADVRLQENLREGLKWAVQREKAAWLLAAYGGRAEIEFLTGLASSALIEGDVRRAVRSALAETNHGAGIDWLASLTADFNELTSCKQRREVIEQMAKTGDAGFLPLLAKHRPIKTKKRFGRTKTTNACIGDAVEAAISALKSGGSSDADGP